MKILLPFWEDNKQKNLSQIRTPLQRNLLRKMEALGPRPHTYSTHKKILNYKEGSTTYLLGTFQNILLQMLSQHVLLNWLLKIIIEFLKDYNI